MGHLNTHLDNDAQSALPAVIWLVENLELLCKRSGNLADQVLPQLNYADHYHTTTSSVFFTRGDGRVL